MSLTVLLDCARKLLKSSMFLRVEFLGTKVRAYLPNDHFLDVYHNATLNKYSYTIIKHGQRIIGWDNADHHRYIKSQPHHFHDANGNVKESLMKGDPLKDLDKVLKETKKILGL